MGFLYPWHMIREGQIPSRDDFDAVRKIIMKALHQNSDVVAASIYGSVMRGDHNVRSDLDLAVVCRNESIRRTQRFIERLRVNARKRHVVVCAHVHTVSEARAGHHPFGPSYLVTMRSIFRKNECVKGIPHQYFVCSDKNVRTEMERKLARYLKALQKHVEAFHQLADKNLPEYAASEWLKKSYQAGVRPFHYYISFARWMLWWHHGELLDDRKDTVVKSFLDEPSLRLLHADFRALREFDRDYDALFAEARAETISETKYHRDVFHMVATVYEIVVRLFERARIFTTNAPRRERERLRLAA